MGQIYRYSIFYPSSVQVPSYNAMDFKIHSSLNLHSLHSSGVVVETEGGIQKTQKRALFHYNIVCTPQGQGELEFGSFKFQKEVRKFLFSGSGGWWPIRERGYISQGEVVSSGIHAQFEKQDLNNFCLGAFISFSHFQI